jgi:chloramphenicol 3-O-phosphotransferase
MNLKCVVFFVAEGNEIFAVHVLCARSELQDILNLLTGDLCHCAVNVRYEGREKRLL